jgi:hypothetical protein
VGIYEGQHGFRPGHSCKIQVVTVCQDIVDSLDEEVRTDAIIIDFSKAFDLVPRNRLVTKMAATSVDLRAVVWVNEFLLRHLQRVRVDGQQSGEVRVTSGVPQGSVLGPLLFLACVNDIWRNNHSNPRLFADECIIYRKIMDSSDNDKLQTDLNNLGELAIENKMKINLCKSKAVSFKKGRVKERIQYSLENQSQRQVALYI